MEWAGYKTNNAGFPILTPTHSLSDLVANGNPRIPSSHNHHIVHTCPVSEKDQEKKKADRKDAEARSREGERRRVGKMMEGKMIREAEEVCQKNGGQNNKREGERWPIPPSSYFYPHLSAKHLPAFLSLFCLPSICLFPPFAAWHLGVLVFNEACTANS